MRQISIAIIGCCVSRDVFNYLPTLRYNVRRFIQLNPISLTFNKVSFNHEIHLDSIRFQSDFIRKCAEHALKGDVIESILESKADKLIIDLAEERIPKLLIHSKETNIGIVRHDYFKNLTDSFLKWKERYGCREVRFNALPKEEVQRAYKHFVDIITGKTGGFRQEDIIIVEVYMAKFFIGKDYCIHEYNTENSPFSKEYINDVNEYLSQLYLYMKTLLPKSKVIRIPENVLSTYFHRWGRNPLHFTSDTYEYLSKCMEICMDNSNENTLDVLYEELKFRNYLIRKVLEKQDNEKS